MTQSRAEMKNEMNYSSKGKQGRKLPGCQDSQLETQQGIKRCLTMAEKNAGKGGRGDSRFRLTQGMQTAWAILEAG